VWLGTRLALAVLSLFTWFGKPHPNSVAEIALSWGNQWDSRHFLKIAAHGYQPSSTDADAAFFPGYPGLIRLLTPVALGHPVVAALAISNIALFAMLMLLYHLAEHELGRPVADRTIFYLVAPRSSSRPRTTRVCSSLWRLARSMRCGGNAGGPLP
jgi:hypothetical protein